MPGLATTVSVNERWLRMPGLATTVNESGSFTVVAKPGIHQQSIRIDEILGFEVFNYSL